MDGAAGSRGDVSELRAQQTHAGNVRTLRPAQQDSTAAEGRHARFFAALAYCGSGGLTWLGSDRKDASMKVVLFCGGLGMRIREAGENVPKPMVTIGYRPILWHVMKYYAHHGHRDFVLCLGHRAAVIKNYFLNYSECLSNDFVLSEGGKKVDLLGSDIHDWKITFVETGLTSNIGQRLKAVERIVGDEPEFLANYSDGLCDLSLDTQLQHFRSHDAVASFVSVKPNLSYHVVS